MIVAVTGHRPNKLETEGRYHESYWIDIAKKGLLQVQPEVVYTGMALGWDQVVAKACIDLGLPYVAAVPFRGQESRWPLRERLIYRELVEAAQAVHVVSTGPYGAYKLIARDRWMIDRAQVLLACWSGTPSGGTARAVSYAKAAGVRLVNVWPETVGV